MAKTLNDIIVIIGGIAFLTACLFIIDSFNGAVDSFWERVSKRKEEEQED